MSEYSPHPSPLQLLERQFPDVIKSSLIVDSERCYCGACRKTISPYAVSELDRCDDIECGAGWVRTLTNITSNKLPLHSFLLPVLSARSVWERKTAIEQTRPSPISNLRRRSIARVAVNPDYL